MLDINVRAAGAPLPADRPFETEPKFIVREALVITQQVLIEVRALLGRSRLLRIAAETSEAGNASTGCTPLSRGAMDLTDGIISAETGLEELERTITNLGERMAAAEARRDNTETVRSAADVDDALAELLDRVRFYTIGVEAVIDEYDVVPVQLSAVKKAGMDLDDAVIACGRLLGVSLGEVVS